MDGYASKHRTRPAKDPPLLPIAPSRLFLSQAIARCSTFCDERKISLVNRNIATIDKVPSKYWNVEMLYLSNNEIRELSGLAQFASVQKVSLTGNFIESLQQLAPLQSLKCLESLSLEGNPVTGVPIYRTFVIDFIDSLKMLDSVQVWDADRAKAKIDLQQFRRICELVVGNEEEIAKLEHIKGLIKLHQHLHQIGKISTDFPSVLRLRNLMSLSWPDTVEMQITESLSLKAQSLLAENRSSDWLWAYTQCMLTQQHVLATLLTECEQLEQSHKQSAMELEKPIKQVALSKNVARKLKKSMSGSNSMAKSVDFSQVQSEISQKISAKRSEVRINIPVYPKVTQKKEDLAHQLLHHSLRSAVSPRDSVPFSPRSSSIQRPKSMISSKKEGEDLAALRQIRMENQILRENLAELRGIHNLQESSSQCNKESLEVQLRKLTEELNTTKHELEMYKGRLEVTRARNSSVIDPNEGTLPAEKASNRELSQHAETIYRRKLRRKAIVMWKINVEFGKRMRDLTGEVKDFHESVELLVVMKAWRKALAVNRFCINKNREKAMKVVKVFVIICRSEIKKSRIVAKTRINHNFQLLKTAFFGLISQTRASKRMRKISQSASAFFMKQIAKRALTLLSKYAHSWQIPPIEEALMLEKARSHRKEYLSNFVWAKWQEWRNRFGIKQRRQLLTAYTGYANRLILLLFGLLRRNLSIYDGKRREAFAMCERRSRFYALSWIEEVSRRIKRRKVAAVEEAISDRFYMKSLVSALRNRVQMSISKKQIIAKVDSIHRLKTVKRVITGLSFIAKYHSFIEYSSRTIKNKSVLRRSRGYFFHWISQLIRPISKKQRTYRENCHKILIEWGKFAKCRIFRRQKYRLSSKLFAAKFTNRLKLLLWGWSHHCIKSKKLVLLQNIVTKRREKRVTFDLFCSWRLANAGECFAKSKENVITGNYKLREALQLQAHLDELAEEKSALECALSAMRKESAEMQSAFDRQKLALKNTERQASDCKSKNCALEQTVASLQVQLDLDKQENFREIEKLRSVITQLSNDLERKSAELVDQKSKFDDVSHRFSLLDQASKLEIAHLSSAVVKLKSALETKETALTDAEKLCEVLSAELHRSEIARGEDLKSHNSELNRFHEVAEEDNSDEGIVEENEEDEGEKRLEELHQQQAEIRKELALRMRKTELRQAFSPTSSRGYH